MSFTVDKYLNKRFNLHHYNCWDLVREVMIELTGKDIGDRTPNPPTALSRIRKFNDEEKDFIKLDKPESPCIVLFKRKKGIPHVGVFWKNKVLHLPETGAKYQPLNIVAVTFTDIGFYKCK